MSKASGFLALAIAAWAGEAASLDETAPLGRTRRAIESGGQAP